MISFVEWIFFLVKFLHITIFRLVLVILCLACYIATRKVTAFLWQIKTICNVAVKWNHSYRLVLALHFIFFWSNMFLCASNCVCETQCGLISSFLCMTYCVPLQSPSFSSFTVLHFFSPCNRCFSIKKLWIFVETRTLICQSMQKFITNFLDMVNHASSVIVFCLCNTHALNISAPFHWKKSKTIPAPCHFCISWISDGHILLLVVYIE